ncbi:Expansin-B18 [Camellia lanceoleosa]|uniref:Expansin-B18 n=1 Tax=Camellia lanceoleosa TaxID=1840588 RepID=A0ACC0IK98_9ERIC|nr:Expansin-B18 [Camellia lanceoleosa]
MRSFLKHLHTLFTFIALLSLFIISSNAAFSSTIATWYGDPNGFGANGGACGYTDILGKAPFYKMVSAGGYALFKSGIGCGTCYQVKCTSNPACSGYPLTVTISDFCPGTCGAYQFDLSGVAFGAMAIRGREDELRHAGQVQIQYQRVPCHYTGFNLAFRINSGSNPYYFATAMEYENGAGDISRVEIQNGASGSWLPMQQSFGAVWKINAAMPGPLSFRITSSFRQTLVATNVIPVGWQPNQMYYSHVNF